MKPSAEHPSTRGFASRALGTVATLAVAALVVMLASTLLQVVMRYGLRAPPVWTEELARYGMVWAGLLGAVVAFAQRADPVLVVGWSGRAGWRGRWAAVCRAIATTVFLGPVVWFSVFGPGLNPARGFLGRSAGRQSEMLDIPMIWVTAVVPVALGAIIVLAWIQALSASSISAAQGPESAD
jgi:TRAP-type C4-dicarboxylate transport system permease small subunit